MKTHIIKLSIDEIKTYPHIRPYLLDYTIKNPDNLNTIYDLDTYFKRKRYYNKFSSAVIDVCKQKEIMIMSHYDPSHCQRGYILFNEDNFKFLSEYRNIISQDYKIYMSCATFSFIPIFTNDLKLRSTATNQWYSKIAETSLINYDILIDLDMIDDNFKQMVSQTLNIHKTLNQFGIMHYIIPSGKSFQIIIKNNLKSGLLQHNIINFVRMLKFNYSFSCIDLSGCAAISKVMKIPYSLVHTLSCLPLDYNHIEKLNKLTRKEYYLIFDSDNVVDRYSKDRGILWFNNDPENVGSHLFKMMQALTDGYYNAGGE